MSQIVFLSCTKSKLDKTSQAQDLYSASPMFRKTLEYGKSFKPETNIVTGSPAVLLDNLLKERGKTVVSYDPHVDKTTPEFRSGVYFVATQHPEFIDFEFFSLSIHL